MDELEHDISEETEEEIEQTQVTTIEVGHRVRKLFAGHDYFAGLVVDIQEPDDDGNDILYRVGYEDGDGEDLFLHELEPILIEKLSPSKEASEVVKV